LNNDFKPTNDSTKFVDDSSIFEVVLQNARSKLDQLYLKSASGLIVTTWNYMGKNKGIKDYIFRP
jgi:hypothetical protein